jgi:hypothetical protein
MEVLMNNCRQLFSSLLVVHLVSTAAYAQDGAAPKTVTKSVAAATSIAASAPNTTHVCTSVPRSEWMPADEMQLLATHRGYRIKTFKVSKGNCYELYGFDREGRIVEAYFDPITARLKLQNIAN